MINYCGGIVQILVNNETLDVTLEKEQNLGEVYASLCDWMKKSGMYPLSLHLDSQDSDILQTVHWQQRSIDDVKRFDLQAGTINQLQQQQMMTVMDYLLLLKQLIEKSQDEKSVKEEFVNAYGEYSHIRAVLPQLLKLSEDEFAEDFSLLDQCAEEVRQDSSDTRRLAEFDTMLERLRIILLDRLRELTYPLKDLKSAAELLRSMLPALEEAGISLQTGNEGDAYALMFRISEITAKCVRITDILSVEYPQHSFKELQDGMKKLGVLIDKINKTMKNKDPVMLADILEYDMHELLTVLIEQISLLEPEAV